MTSIFRATTSDGALTLDATQFPILIATWTGAISVEHMDRYFEFRTPSRNAPTNSEPRSS